MPKVARLLTGRAANTSSIPSALYGAGDRKTAAISQETDHLKVEDYLGALEALHNASLQAENDVQISHSLKQLVVLLKALPRQVILNCQATLLSLKNSGKQPKVTFAEHPY